MKCNKQDYINIANLIRDSYTDRGADNATILRNRIMQGMAKLIAEDNPSFDSDKFITLARSE